MAQLQYICTLSMAWTPFPLGSLHVAVVVVVVVVPVLRDRRSELVGQQRCIVVPTVRSLEWTRLGSRLHRGKLPFKPVDGVGSTSTSLISNLKLPRWNRTREADFLLPSPFALPSPHRHVVDLSLLPDLRSSALFSFSLLLLYSSFLLVAALPAVY